jgi:hypothetical protein
MSGNAEILHGLERLLEREAAFIEEMNVVGLEVVGVELEALLAGLRPLDPADRELLLRVEAARQRNESAARRRLADLGSRLTRVDRGQAALRGYSPGGVMGEPARFVDRGA